MTRFPIPDDPIPDGVPRLAAWLLRRVLHASDAEFALGDLVEDFHRIAASAGPRRARRWFWNQTARVVLGHDRSDSTERPRMTLGEQMTNMFHDIRMALRAVRLHPVASSAAILTLALGIGANAAIFSVAWPVLAAPLPLPDEDRLALVMLSVERGDTPRPNPISPGDYFDIKRSRSFQTLAGFNRGVNVYNLTGVGDPQQLSVVSVTGEFFSVMGVAPIVGRGIDVNDAENYLPSLVLHERTWRRHFDADPNVVGKAALLDGQAWTIVGVMPGAATIGTADVDAWTPLPLDPVVARSVRSYFLVMVGRLRPNVTVGDANVELADLMRGVAAEYPETNTGISARAESLRERLTGPVRPAFMLLLGGAALVLLVAGINLAGLQVARNLGRAQELTVRRALGAARGRIVRQLTTESLVLSCAGGAAGLAAASATLRALATVAPTIAWYDVSPSLTWPVALFTLAVTLIAGLAIGLAPAWLTVARSNAVPSASRGGTTTRTGARLRTVVLGSQVAMTVVLLIAATLIGVSLLRVLNVDPGFDLDRGLIADVRVAGQTSARIQLFDELISRAEALPGAERACAINHVPLDNNGAWMTFVPGGGLYEDRVQALPLGISDGCFEVLRVPVLAGRAFTRSESNGVAILSESMAKALFPDEASPLDREVHIGLATGPAVRVVGIVPDLRTGTLEERGLGQVWTPMSRGWPQPERLMVRTSAAPESLATPLRSLLRELDPNLALANVRTMQDVVGTATASRRFVLILLGGFALIAVALCAVGIYGVLSHQVGQRTREIGIRLALGAGARQVMSLVTRQVVAAVLAGLAVGAAGAWALSSILATQLFEMSATDARVYAGVAVFVALVSAIAALPPLRRALGVEPIVALRE